MAGVRTLALAQGITQHKSFIREDATIVLTVGEARGITPKSIESSLSESLSQLRNLIKLNPNWDSYDGLPPTEEAIAKAASLLSILDEHLGIDTRPYRIAPLPDGGIHLSWKRPQSETEVEFSPEGILGFIYVEKEDGQDKSYIEEEHAPWWKALRYIEKTLLGQA